MVRKWSENGPELVQVRQTIFQQANCQLAMLKQATKQQAVLQKRANEKAIADIQLI